MNKYKKILASSLTVLGTCLSLVGCNMGGDNSGDDPSHNTGSNQKKFEAAVDHQRMTILYDIEGKIENQKSRFATSPKINPQGRWVPKGRIDKDYENWHLMNPTYKGEKDGLIFGTATTSFGKVTGYGDITANIDMQMPILVVFTENNMVYSSQNSGFDSGISKELFGTAFDYDFSVTGLLMPTLKNGSNDVAKRFFNHDVNENSFGTPDLWDAGYSDILSIAPNNGKLEIGSYQNNLSFLNAKIMIACYRYGYYDPSTDYQYPGYRHFAVLTITFGYDDKTGVLDIKVDTTFPEKK